MFRRILTLAPLLAAACRADRVGPPSAEFLLVAGDSTFWVHSVGAAVRARPSPIQLARYGGRFYEIYIVDDDRSYTDAEIVGQQVWRRDLLAGDSAVVFDDTTIAGVERWYTRLHPDDRPLDPDEDFDGDPHVSATSELELLDQFGPYASYEYRADLTATGGDEWHTARRGVLDLRHGGDASLRALFGPRVAHQLVRRGAALFAQTLDSVLASHDVRARAAVSAIGDFEFDSTSFALVEVDGAPAVEFVATGRGSRAGGLLLPLPPIPVAPPPWWSEVRRWLPERTGPEGSEWTHGSYRVAAREDTATGTVRLAVIDSTGRSWPVGALPAPPRRIYWLDGGAADSTTLRALERAFDEAALYSDDARTAMTTPPGTRPDAQRVIPAMHPKTPRESEAIVADLMMPQHANGLRRPSVFGGVIMSMVDRAAALSAMKHAGGQATTLSIDRILFKEPIRVGELVEVRARVVFVGRTSMAVLAHVYAEDIITGQRRHTNECWLTFVHLDDDGRPAPVPPLALETEEDRHLHEIAARRREQALAERA